MSAPTHDSRPELDVVLRALDREPPPPRAGLEAQLLAQFARRGPSGRVASLSWLLAAAAVLLAALALLRVTLEPRSEPLVESASLDAELWTLSARSVRQTAALDLLEQRLWRARALMANSDEAERAAPTEVAAPTVSPELARCLDMGRDSLERSERVAIVRFALLERTAAGQQEKEQRYRELARQYPDTGVAPLALARIERHGNR